MVYRLVSRGVAALAVATFAGIASADTVYLATHYRTLYRATQETAGSEMVIETFDLGTPIRGLCFDGASVYGVVSAAGASESDFVKVANPVSGTPSLVDVAHLNRTYGSLTKVGELFYGTAGGGFELYSIDMSDPANPVETFVGANPIGGFGATAYDPVGDVLYGVSKYTDALYEMDRATGALSGIGYLGIDDLSAGAEWFDDDLYFAVQNRTSGDFEVGTLDVSTGFYTPTLVMGEGVAREVATGLAIIPEPTSAVLLVVSSLVLLGRKR